MVTVDDVLQRINFVKILSISKKTKTPQIVTHCLTNKATKKKKKKKQQPEAIKNKKTISFKLLLNSNYNF